MICTPGQSARGADRRKMFVLCEFINRKLRYYSKLRSDKTWCRYIFTSTSHRPCSALIESGGSNLPDSLTCALIHFKIRQSCWTKFAKARWFQSLPKVVYWTNSVNYRFRFWTEQVIRQFNSVTYDRDSL